MTSIEVFKSFQKHLKGPINKVPSNDNYFKVLKQTKGNGEDLFFNLFLQNVHKKKPQLVEGKFKTLYNGGGYSAKPDHYRIRGDLCRKYGTSYIEEMRKHIKDHLKI